MSGNLMGQDVRARMAAILLTRAQNRLVVRVGVDFVSGEFPHIGLRRRISIYLLTFCKTEGQEGFFEVRYLSDDDPTGWYQAKFELKPLYTIGPWGSELLAVPEQERSLIALQSQLALWEILFPPFVSAAEEMIGVKDQRGSFSNRPIMNPRTMIHFSRLYGRLEQLLKSGGSSDVWVAETFLKRLGPYLAASVKVWADWNRQFGIE
ncbi:MAG: hypothetical protein XU08_C0003G0117 [candidate division WWE3 bacterium CSP1-7]|uniref:Uncharacterized protein n=1 Tax=candidate division WWE3 bacterium CSP1-7 TaxID=1576480 RepID=A0A0T5ZXB4_UNCKA|nr:MAG: hypothetical protein XU08_C0003G0117 [candidate division WWE3 bacterium CSP1-7]